MSLKGIGAADVDRMEMWQVWATMGQHRHPDYWAPDESAAPTRGKGRQQQGGGVSSERVPSGEDRITQSRDLFAARRAHALGEGPPPEPAQGNEQGLAAMVLSM